MVILCCERPFIEGLQVFDCPRIEALVPLW